MKSIVFTVTNDLTYDQRMQRICSTLSANGYQVTLIGFLKKRSVKISEADYTQIRLNPFFKKGKFFYIEYNWRLFWWLLFRRFDLYCGIDLDTLLPVFINARLKRKVCIYDAHEYFTELPEIVDRPFIKRCWVILEKFLLPRIRYNYTVSDSIADALRKRSGHPYEVIRNVPVLMDSPQTAFDAVPYVLYQGALNKGRGLEQLMLAMEWVNAELWIAGEGDLSAELRSFAKKLPHAEKIRFLGYLRPTELSKYTYGARAGVNLVENLGLSYYYSLSNKFFDYIHAHKPQITMNFPEYRSLNDRYHVALLIPDLQPTGIASAINRILTDEQLYNELVLNTGTAKKELNWQAESKKLISFYQSIGK